MEIPWYGCPLLTNESVESIMILHKLPQVRRVDLPILPPRVSDVKRYQIKNCICLVTHENHERTEIFGSVVVAATVLAVW